MLSIVPTPIGNLKDITIRALEALKSVDVIVCEDTRQTQKLLNAYEIKKPLISLHEHSGVSKVKVLIEKLEQGESLALVSDGGTPVLSDPGFELTHEAILKGIRVEVLPGATAIIPALVASGLAVDQFSFFGFPPPKSAARKKFLEKLSDREETMIFYESPHRILKTLHEMLEVYGNREAVVARELTKKFEEVSRGTLTELVERFSKKKALGEIVVLVAGKDRKRLF